MLLPTPQTILPSLRLLLLACLLVLAGCNSVPYARDGELPPRVEVADGSAQRAELNARTYDAAVRHARQLFYRDTSAFTRIAGARRASVISQPDEDSFYSALNEVLAVLDDAHSHAVTPGRRANNEEVRRDGGRDAGIGYGFIGAKSGLGESVLSVLPDISASRAGILPGWQIVSVDGQPPWMHQKREGQPAHFVFSDREGHEHERDMNPGPTPPVRLRESRTLPGNLLPVPALEILQQRHVAMAENHAHRRK